MCRERTILANGKASLKVNLTMVKMMQFMGQTYISEAEVEKVKDYIKGTFKRYDETIVIKDVTSILTKANQDKFERFRNTAQGNKTVLTKLHGTF